MAGQDDAGDGGAANRGAPARIGPDGGVAGTGGGGSPEDYDSDPAGGAGGDVEPRAQRPDQAGGDAPSRDGG